ncbi:MAG: hypothetical protein RL417_275 [Pseudomonadota bacterium]|jgi:hypothetical protein
MNRKNVFFLSLIGVMGLTLWKLLSISLGGLFTPEVFPATGLTAAAPWFPLTHLGSNASIPWRFDPFLARLALLCPSPLDALLGFQLLFYCLGLTTVCLLIAPSVGLRSAIVTALIAGGALLHLFARDVLVFGALVWWPWIIVALLQASRTPLNRAFPFFVILFFFSLRATKSGNLLSPFIIGLGVVLALMLSRSNGRPVGGSTIIGVLAAFIPFLITPIFTEIGAPPDYPPYARFVSPEGTTGFVRALVGSDREIPTIDRSVLAAGYTGVSFALLLISAWGWLLTRKQRPSLPVATACLTAATVLAFSAVWDTALGDNGAIGPLRSIARIVPELGFAPLIPLAVGSAFTLLLMVFTVCQRITPIIAAVGLIILSDFRGVPPSVSLTAPPGTVQGIDQKTARDIGLLVLNSADPTADLLVRNLLSPSAALAIRDEIGGTLRPTDHSPGSFESAAPFIARIEASHGRERVAALIDGNPKTRWSPQRGRQFGDEWLKIYLKQPERLTGLALELGDFFSDSPGGIAVLPCEPERGAPLLTVPRWLGPIRRTPGGYLFYGEERDVSLHFKESAPLSCIELRQTASHRPFDWSIAELGLQRAPAQR